jgi:diaminopropionate ammonia-lyase
MAMLECYEPSPLAWRVLSRVADAFMTAEDDAAVAVMNRLARPKGNDPAVVAGESGGAGLAGAIHAASDPQMREQLGIDANSRIFAVITEGATDPLRYRELVGLDAATIGKP